MAFQAYASIHHMDLDMPSSEYRQLLKKNGNKFKRSDSEIELAISMGERLYQWIETINKTRAPENQLRITSPANRRKYPIESPSISSPKTIAEATRNNLQLLTPEIEKVLLSQDNFPTVLSVDDKTFADMTLPVEQNYRDAARYKMQIKRKVEYTREAYRDVRGYHYLKTNHITGNELRDSRKLDPERLKEILSALTQICINDSSETARGCREKVEQALAVNSLAEFYDQYFSGSEATWKRFFSIPKNEIRKDTHWLNQTLYVPFKKPVEDKFISFLRDNIEDEFRWGNWTLRMDFGLFETAPELVFVPGTTPHVPSGNNSIVMDANQSLDEYDTKWVIRHEFGHILGLPDCYHEFYDESIEAFVSYQLDVSDLMCSRAGNMNERIFLELQKVYGQ